MHMPWVGKYTNELTCKTPARHLHTQSLPVCVPSCARNMDRQVTPAGFGLEGLLGLSSVSRDCSQISLYALLTPAVC